MSAQTVSRRRFLIVGTSVTGGFCLGIPSAAPALTIAIYRASGVRVRKLPIPRKLI